MNGDYQDFLRSNPLERHPKYFLGDPRNADYKLHVVISQPAEEFTLASLIVYDQAICSDQFLYEDFQRQGTMNSHIDYLNKQGLYLLSEKEIIELHQQKMELSKAKGILKMQLFVCLAVVIPLIGFIIKSPEENLWLLYIIAIIVIMMVFTIIKSIASDLNDGLREILK